LDAAGIPIGLSSDRPIVPVDPRIGIMMATHRKVEAVSFDRAVDLYTFGAADVDGDGALFGRLNIRQFADFQVYDKDPQHEDAKLLGVYMDGVNVTQS
jgi:predicted amidohydrolase YtcJ